MIERVIETLTPPGSWIQGNFARTTPAGRTIGPSAPGANCWCLVGAIIRADADADGLEARDQAYQFVVLAAQELFPKRIGISGIPVFNDHPDTTHADVLRVLNRARELELAAHEAHA